MVANFFELFEVFFFKASGTISFASALRANSRSILASIALLMIPTYF